MVKTGLAALGGSAFIGAASAHDPDNRRHDSFTWANNEVWEMLDAEPGLYDESDMVDPEQDSEGDHEGQRPIWIIAAHPSDPHSPHPNPGGLPVDHVIDLEPGKRFYSAQWHIHLVLDPEQPFVCIDNCSPDDPDDPVLFPNFVNQDASGRFLTSADRIRSAIEAGDVFEFHTDGAFTCPVRPHLD